MNTKSLFVILFCSFVCAASVAQPATNLTTDKEFFDQQAQAYQKWLLSSGLGNVLKVQTVETHDTLVTLYLAFYTTNADSASALWRGLKSDYESQHIGGGTLEQALFYKMLYYMELKPEQSCVQIFNDYSGKNISFDLALLYKVGKVVLEWGPDLKSVEKRFEVNRQDLSGASSISKANFNEPSTQKKVFDKIKGYAYQRFVQEQSCENRKPQIETIKDKDELYFIITDVCKEVLSDESNPWWCQMLSPLYNSYKNCRAREMLIMHIYYHPTHEGFLISCELDVKFGSGLSTESSRGAYKNMDLDHKGDVDRYADKFTGELYKVLVR